jgi:hypothetical protein
MLFLQQGPAQTSTYLIAGYAVIFGVMLVYLISLAIRQRNLLRDMETFKEIEKKDS